MIIKVDFDENLGKIKPMHGVGQPPFYNKIYIFNIALR